MVALRFLFLITITVFCQPLLAEVSATLNRDNIGFNETVTLTLTTDDSGVDNFDASAIEKNFEILSTRSSSQRTIINFKASFQKTWQLTLSPKKTGTLTIGPLSLGKEKTQTLTLKVSDAKGGVANGEAQDLFLEVSSDKTSYTTQEQIIVTIKLNDALGLRNLQLSPLNIDNSFVEELKQSQYQRSINGKTYNTYEIRYAVFAQASGKLTIPSVVAHGVQITNRQRSSAFSQSYSQPVRSKSQPFDITINPPPANAAKPWLPAKRFSITESFSQAPENLKVGDSLTRSITLNAVGLSHEQLPTIKAVELQGIKIYQEVETQETKASAQNVTSTKVIQQTLVFTQAGKYELPEIAIDWFDTQNQKNQTATLKGLSLDIAANPALANSAPKTASTNTAPKKSAMDKDALTLKPKQEHTNKPWYNTKAWPWQLATVLLAMLSIALMITLSKRKKPMTEQEKPDNSFKQAVQAFEDACKAKDVQATQKTLKQLARLQNPKLKIYSLADVQRAFNSESLQQFIIDLDKASVNKGHGVNWPLAQECVQLFKQQNTKDKVLPTLYPE